MDENGAEYIVSGILFDDLVPPATSKNNTYINIYRFVTEPFDPKYPFGYFTYGSPIDAHTLKL